MKAFLRKPRMNNIQLGYQRNDLTYEAVITDLVLMGIVDKEVAEQFMGRQLGEGLRVPEGAKELLSGSVEDSFSSRRTI